MITDITHNGKNYVLQYDIIPKGVRLAIKKYGVIKSYVITDNWDKEHIRLIINALIDSVEEGYKVRCDIEDVIKESFMEEDIHD